MTGDNPYASSVHSELFGKSLFWKMRKLIKTSSRNTNSHMKSVCSLDYIFQSEPVFDRYIDILCT